MLHILVLMLVILLLRLCVCKRLVLERGFTVAVLQKEGTIFVVFRLLRGVVLQPTVTQKCQFQRECSGRVGSSLGILGS